MGIAYSELDETELPEQGAIFHVPGFGDILAWGRGAPKTGTGFAPGCIYVNIEATSQANAIYTNVGTVNAANFQLLYAAGASAAVSLNDAINNAVTDLMTLNHSTTGAPTAGIGTGLSFGVEDAGGTEEQGSIDVVLTNVTNNQEDADMIFKTNIAGTITTLLRLVADASGAGGAKLVQIGSDANQVSLDIHPGTTNSGTLRITAEDSAGDTVTQIVNASQAGARAYTIPDAGGDTTFVMAAGTQTIAGQKTFSSALKNSAGVGTAAGTGVTVAEFGDGKLHQSIFTLVNTPVPLTDEAGVVAWGGVKFYTTAQGAILTLGATSDLAITKSSAGVNDNWDGDMAIGTVLAANDATLTGTEANIIPSTATPQAVAGATTGKAQSTATELTVKDGTAAGVEMYLNLLVDDADHDVGGTACNLICNGTITVTWVNLGDYA